MKTKLISVVAVLGALLAVLGLMGCQAAAVGGGPPQTKVYTATIPGHISDGLMTGHTWTQNGISISAETIGSTAGIGIPIPGGVSGLDNGFTLGNGIFTNASSTQFAANYATDAGAYMYASGGTWNGSAWNAVPPFQAWTSLAFTITGTVSGNPVQINVTVNY